MSRKPNWALGLAALALTLALFPLPAWATYESVTVTVQNPTWCSFQYSLTLDGESTHHGPYMVAPNSSDSHTFSLVDTDYHTAIAFYHCMTTEMTSYGHTQFEGNTIPIEIHCDCPPPEGCFLAGTPISMADGTSKPIESVRVGDRVLSFDPTGNRTVGAAVTAVFQHDATEMAGSYLVINQRIKVTSEHPLFLDGAWIRAGQARVGQKLQSIDSTTEVITSIDKVEAHVAVYNIEVEGLHSYYAGGVLAHNKPITCRDGNVVIDPD